MANQAGANVCSESDHTSLNIDMMSCIMYIGDEKDRPKFFQPLRSGCAGCAEIRKDCTSVMHRLETSCSAPLVQAHLSARIPSYDTEVAYRYAYHHLGQVYFGWCKNGVRLPIEVDLPAIVSKFSSNLNSRSTHMRFETCWPQKLARIAQR